MQTAAEKRKSIRRSVTYPAFIELGGGAPARECTLCDASQQGAQLAVADPATVPNEFILALSSDGAARRRCRVIWRTESSVGVEFLKDVKKVVRRARMPFVHAGALAPATAVAEQEVAAEAATESSVPADADQVDIDTLASR